MTGIVALLIIPEEVPSLLAVLGLLFCWELHDVEIRQGRIKPQSLIAYLIPLRIELPTVGTRPTLFIYMARNDPRACRLCRAASRHARSEEHTSELQSRQYIVCRLLLEKKK